MQCQECKEQLLELVYEEGIRPRRKLELLDHVDNCPFCHEQYTELLESRAFLQEWTDEEPTWILRVRPEAQAKRSWALRLQRSIPSIGWLRPVLPGFRGALIAALILIAALTVTQSAVTWNDHGVTVQARLWKSGATAGSNSNLSQQELLEAVDRMIAASEQRQNKQFSTALYQVWEDLKVKDTYEHNELQTGFQALQKQNQDRWEQFRRTTQ
ncbi:MAG TPA: hypothetical protein VGL91_21865 [Acidobacteriota bacterium]|jgi:hypothetical protein